MTLRYIDTELRHQGIGRSKLRYCERRNRELTDAQEADTELSDTDNATGELSDSDDAACHDWSSVGSVLERDMDERQTRNRDLRLVLVAPAVPCILGWIRSTALWTSECLLRDLVFAFATGLHQWPLCPLTLAFSRRRERSDEGTASGACGGLLQGGVRPAQDSSPSEVHLRCSGSGDAELQGDDTFQRIRIVRTVAGL